MRNAEWQKRKKIIPNSVTPGRPASKLRNSDCGMRIEKENKKNPKSAIRNKRAGAFRAQRPCFRATRIGISKVQGGKGEFIIDENFKN
jgi:hypothetical protein